MRGGRQRRGAAGPAIAALALGAVATLAAGVGWLGPEAEPVATGDSPSSRPRVLQVVSVEAGGEGQTPELATGFTVRRGLVVTVAHLVDDGTALAVRAGPGPARRARVLEVDRDADLALLAAPGLEGRPTAAAAGTPKRRSRSPSEAAAASADTPKRRSRSPSEAAAAAAGTPRRRSRSPSEAAAATRVAPRPTQPDGAGRLLLLRDGAVAARPAPVRRRIDARVEDPDGGRTRRRPALELAARVSAGDSGAPLLTPEGALAGVVFARSRTRPRIAYAVDVAAVTRLLHAGDRASSR